MSHVHAVIVHPGPLTQAETRVLKYLCEGCMRKEIARRLFRSYGCVSKQIESIADKLDAHSAAEIVSVAVAQGMVDIKILQAGAQRALIQCLLIALLTAGQYMDVRQPPRPGRQSARLIRIRPETNLRGNLWI